MAAPKSAARKSRARKSTSSTPKRKPASSKTASSKTGATTTRAGKTAGRKSPARKRSAKTSATATPARSRPSAKSSRRWSRQVTEHSDALDLKQGVFKLGSAKKIAASLKRSAEKSSRRKTGAYRSALSMLVFYINRAGKNLSKTERDRLERAKLELRHQFGRA
jgi:hypothetical protein